MVVVLSTEALLRQEVSETGSAAGRKAVNEPMEEAFISWVYREGGDKARKTLQSGMVTWAFVLAEMGQTSQRNIPCSCCYCEGQESCGLCCLEEKEALILSGSRCVAGVRGMQ